MQAQGISSVFVCVVSLGAACGGSSDVAPPPAHGLQLAVAPLTLPGVGVVCYDVRVSTPSGVVWSQGDPQTTALGAAQNGGPATGTDGTTLCSDRYGNSGGGDIAYVGPCDASAEADTIPGGAVQNDVTIWVDGLYSGSPETAGAVDIGAWRNPCPAQGCTVSFDCVEDQDTRVEFNFTVMRDASQGFFDVAVSFEDIFCSAKLDTCYAEGAPGTADDRPITLLFGGDATRDPTAVVGFACTAGPDATATQLMYGEILVTCSGGETFTLDPTVDPGNAEATSNPGAEVAQYAVYRGLEQLQCGAGSCQKTYWNLAINLGDLATLGDCTLTFEATATDNGEGFDEGLPTAAGVAWPYVVVDAQLTDDGDMICQQNPLNGTGSAVRTAYRGASVGPAFAPKTMWAVLSGTVATCIHEGGCEPVPCGEMLSFPQLFRAAAVTTGPCNDTVIVTGQDLETPINTGAGSDTVSLGSVLRANIALGEGDNRMTVMTAATDMALTAGAGADTVELGDGSALTLRVNSNLGGGADMLTIHGPIFDGAQDLGDGDDVVELNTPSQSDFVRAVVRMGAGNDVVELSGPSTAYTLTSITGDDYVFGTANNTLTIYDVERIVFGDGTMLPP